MCKGMQGCSEPGGQQGGLLLRLGKTLCGSKLLPEELSDRNGGGDVCVSLCVCV